jgi:hypothetical protein
MARNGEGRPLMSTSTPARSPRRRLRRNTVLVGAAAEALTLTGLALASPAHAHQLGYTITSITPTSGPAVGGNTITITGSGFEGVNCDGPLGDDDAAAAAFHHIPVSYTAVSDTTMTAIVPAGAAGTTAQVDVFDPLTCAATATASPAPANRRGRPSPPSARLAARWPAAPPSRSPAPASPPPARRQPGAGGHHRHHPAGTSTTSSADQYSHTCAFTGYQVPVDKPPTLNQVHAGQAIPIKFSSAAARA